MERQATGRDNRTDMKRKIFMAIGWLTTIAHLSAPFLIWGASQPWAWGIYFLSLLGYYIAMIFFCMAAKICTPAFWFWAPAKRIFHAEAGEAWAQVEEGDARTQMNSWGATVCIYKQRWLLLKQIARVEYTDEQERLVSRIRSGLDEYMAQKEEKKARNTRRWPNGTDTQTRGRREKTG